MYGLLKIFHSTWKPIAQTIDFIINKHFYNVLQCVYIQTNKQTTKKEERKICNKQKYPKYWKRCTKFSPEEARSILCLDISASRHSNLPTISSSCRCVTNMRSLSYSEFCTSQWWSLALIIFPISDRSSRTGYPRPSWMLQPLPPQGVSSEESWWQHAP